MVAAGRVNGGRSDAGDRLELLKILVLRQSHRLVDLHGATFDAVDTRRAAREIRSLRENLPLLRKSDSCLSATKNELLSRADSHAVAIGLNFDLSRPLSCRQDVSFTQHPYDDWICIPDSLEKQYNVPADLTRVEVDNRPRRNRSRSFLPWIQDERYLAVTLQGNQVTDHNHRSGRRARNARRLAKDQR